MGGFQVKDLNLVLNTSRNNLKINPFAEHNQEVLEYCDINKTIIIDNLSESF